MSNSMSSVTVEEVGSFFVVRVTSRVGGQLFRCPSRQLAERLQSLFTTVEKK